MITTIFTSYDFAVVCLHHLYERRKQRQKYGERLI
jgi:hypothetical protein